MVIPVSTVRGRYFYEVSVRHFFGRFTFVQLHYTDSLKANLLPERSAPARKDGRERTPARKTDDCLVLFMNNIFDTLPIIRNFVPLNYQDILHYILCSLLEKLKASPHLFFQNIKQDKFCQHTTSLFPLHLND